jgi:FkbM family methyltransferase
VPNPQYPIRFVTKPRTTRIQCARLDDFCREHSIESIDVLKIDREGFDLAVLKGRSRYAG